VPPSKLLPLPSDELRQFSAQHLANARRGRKKKRPRSRAVFLRHSLVDSQ